MKNLWILIAVACSHFAVAQPPLPTGTPLPGDFGSNYLTEFRIDPLFLDRCKFAPDQCRGCEAGVLTLKGYVQDRSGSAVRKPIIALNEKGQFVGAAQWSRRLAGTALDGEFRLQIPCPYPNEIYLTNDKAIFDPKKKFQDQYTWIRDQGVSWYEVLTRSVREAYGPTDQHFLSPAQPEKLGRAASQAVAAPAHCGSRPCPDDSFFKDLRYGKGSFARVALAGTGILRDNQAQDIRLRIVLDYKRSGEELHEFCRVVREHPLCKEIAESCRLSPSACTLVDGEQRPADSAPCSGDRRLQDNWNIHPDVSEYLAKKHMPEFLFDNQNDCLNTHGPNTEACVSEMNRVVPACNTQDNPGSNRSNTDAGSFDDSTLRGKGGSYPTSLEAMAQRSDLMLKCKDSEELIASQPVMFRSAGANNKGIFAREKECDGEMINSSLDGCYSGSGKNYCHNFSHINDKVKGINSYYVMKPTAPFLCGGNGPIYYAVKKTKDLMTTTDCTSTRSNTKVNCGQVALRANRYGTLDRPTASDFKQASCRPQDDSFLTSYLASCPQTVPPVPCQDDNECGRCGFCSLRDAKCVAKVGAATSCVNDGDCPSRRCIAGICVGQCYADSDCANNEFCHNGSCYEGAYGGLGGDYWKTALKKKRKPWEVTTQGDYRIEYIRAHAANPHPSFPDHWGDTEAVNVFVSEGYVSHMHFKHHGMDSGGINKPAKFEKTKDWVNAAVDFSLGAVPITLGFAIVGTVKEQGPAIDVVPQQMKASHRLLGHFLQTTPAVGPHATPASNSTDMHFAQAQRPQSPKVFVAAGSNASYHYPGKWVSEPEVHLKVSLGAGTRFEACSFKFGEDRFRGNDRAYHDALQSAGGFTLAPVSAYLPYQGYLTPPIENVKMPISRAPSCRSKICNAVFMGKLCGDAALAVAGISGGAATIAALCVLPAIDVCERVLNSFEMPLSKTLGGGAL